MTDDNVELAGARDGGRHPFGVGEVRIRGFRSARAVHFAPGAMCALVGGPSVGKSNVLAAIWTLLQQGSPPPAPGDVSTDGPADGAGAIKLGATLAGGDEIWLEATPPGPVVAGGPTVSVLFLPASERSAALVAQPTHGATAQRLAETYFASADASSSAAPAAALVGALERLCHAGERGLVLLGRGAGAVPATAGAALSLPAPAAVLRAGQPGQGRTEKLTMPFVLRALGYDIDREAITIVECSGKPNIPLFIRICHAARIPCLVVYDRDAPPGRKPKHADRIINAEITRLAGPGHSVALAPDFDAIAGLRAHSHKPAHAWERFSHVQAEQLPEHLREIAERIVVLARR